MVESALILLTLVSMILFILDMGRILMMQQYLTERARATVRKAVVNNWDAAATKNYLVYGSTTAPVKYLVISISDPTKPQTVNE